LELFVEVCQAVQHAHQKGIIHRDIKPTNVLVTLHDDKPVVKVIDFGIAKATSGQLTDKTLFTGFAQLIGTPLYMSPEQAAMSGLDVDTRSDIYSLGVLLYELLTGTTPFDKRRLQAAAFDEVRRIIREEEPQKPSTRLSSSASLPSVAANRHLEPGKLTRLVRGDLDWIVMKALDKDRTRRYGTASGLASDVLNYLADEPVTACPPSPAYRFRKFARRNQVALLTTAAVAGALILGTVTSSVLAYRAIEAEGLARTRLTAETAAVKAANDARGAATAAQHDALSMRDRAVADSYRALLGETRALRAARLPGWRDTALNNVRQLATLQTPARDLVELRSETVACLGELDMKEVDRFEGHLHLVYGLDFSPDGSMLASAGYDGNVFLWTLGEHRPAMKLSDDAASSAGLWSSAAPLPVVRFQPGGRCVAYTTWDRQVKFCGMGDRGTVLPAITGQSQPRDIAFDRQGRLMAVSWGNGQAGIYDALTGGVKRMIDAHTPEIGFYMPVALSPAGDLLATRGPGESVQLFRVDSDEPPAVLGTHRGGIRGFAFSSDGRFLASASEDRTAKLWAVGSGKEVLTLQGHTSKVISIAFSPNDELIATGSDDGSLRLWEAQTGQPLMVVPEATPGIAAMRGVQAVAFSPDGRQIAAASTTVFLFEIAPRRMRRLPGHGFMASSVAFHPNRPVLAASSRERDVTLWDVEAGRESQRIAGLGDYSGGLAFDPAGSLLVAASYARTPTTFFGQGVAVLEVGSDRSRKTLPGRLSSAIGFDPSGQWLATGDRQGQIWIWDAGSGELQRRSPVTNGWIADVAFIDNGSRLVVGDMGGLVVLWDLERNRQIAQAALPGGMYRFAIDPHDRLLAVADFMGEVRVLSLSDLEVRATLERIDGLGPVGLAFQGDGQWLAVGGADRRVTIWDTRTFEKTFTLPRFSSPILDLAFQSNGSRLAVAATDELIPIWDVAGLQNDLIRLRLLPEASSVSDSTERARPRDAGPTMSRTGAPQIISAEWATWLLEHMLEIEPNQPQACVELAWIRVMGPKALRDPDAALPLAKRAVELAPDVPDRLNTLGVVYYRLGRWNDAIDALHAAAQANPQGATGFDLYFQAMSHQQLGQTDLAREEFDLATQWWAEAELTTAQVHELDAIRAEADLVLHGKIDPPATAAEQFAAGQTYAGMRVWSIAARHFTRATGLAPEDPETWAELGRCHAHLGEWQEAIRCFATAVERNPDKIEFWYRHAIAYAGAGDLDGYRRTCAAMVDRFGDSSDPGIASQIQYACLPVQDAGATGDELVRIANIAVPWFQGNVRVLGAAHYRAGAYDAALDGFAELRAVGTPKAWDWFFEAMVHARLNHHDEAERCLARATDWIEQANRLDFGRSMDQWVDWFEPVEVGLLRREAETVLEESRQSTGSGSSPYSGDLP
jgi:WD40 repeat protein/tetratricopeptide (TPR) repeat protein